MNKHLPSWCWMLMALVVSACDQEFKLISDGGLESRGILTIHSFPPHEMDVSIRDENFVGQWRSSVVDETERIRRSYGTFSRTYDAYVSGHWDAYLRRGHASLHGSRGTTMECDFESRGEGNGSGVCTDGNGGKYRMML